LSYVIVNADLNFEMMMEYFILAWTFNSFVRPGGIWILSLVMFVPIVAIYWFVSIKKSRDTEYWSVSIKEEENSE
jgi:hypothetical protein